MPPSDRQSGNAATATPPSLSSTLAPNASTKSPVIPAPPTAGFRWVICGLLFLATSINYMDRQVMGLMEPDLRGVFHWTKVGYGHVVLAFQLGYMIGLLGVAWFIDRVGLKLGYAVAIVIWSIAAALTAAAVFMTNGMNWAAGHLGLAVAFTPVAGFCVARFLLGIGEAGNFPAATKAVAEWFPKRERSLATGLFNTGTSSGAMIAPLLVPLMVSMWGWQLSFVALGVAGLAWMVLWLILYRRPERSPFLSEAARAYVRGDAEDPQPQQDTDGGKVGWLQLFGHAQTWGIVVSSALVVPVMWFQVFWLLPFLHDTFGVSLSEAGWPLVTAYGMQFVGSILGGMLATRLIARGRSVHFARKFSLGLCAFLVVPLAFAGLVSSMWAAVLLVGLAMAAMQGWSANSYSVYSDLYPKRAVASMVGLGTAAGSIGSMAFAEFAGRFLEATKSPAHPDGNYAPLFVLAGCGFPLAFAALCLFIPRWTPVQLDTPPQGFPVIPKDLP